MRQHSANKAEDGINNRQENDEHTQKNGIAPPLALLAAPASDKTRKNGTRKTSDIMPQITASVIPSFSGLTLVSLLFMVLLVYVCCGFRRNVSDF
jgi:hypothetical protein